MSCSCESPGLLARFWHGGYVDRMTSQAVGGPDERQEFTAETAGASLREACGAAGVDATGAQLLRLGSNAVYRLPSAPVIVRIARDVDAAEDMERAVRAPRAARHGAARRCPHRGGAA